MEELEEIGDVLAKIRRKISRLQQDTKKSKKKVGDPDGTFLSISTIEELIEVKAAKDDQKEKEKGTQTEVAVKSK